MAISLKLKSNGTVTPVGTGFEVSYSVQVIGPTGSVLAWKTLTVPVNKPDADVAALACTEVPKLANSILAEMRTQGVLEEKARLALPALQTTLDMAAKAKFAEVK